MTAETDIYYSPRFLCLDTRIGSLVPTFARQSSARPAQGLGAFVIERAEDSGRYHAVGRWCHTRSTAERACHHQVGYDEGGGGAAAIVVPTAEGWYW